MRVGMQAHAGLHAALHDGGIRHTPDHAEEGPHQ